MAYVFIVLFSLLLIGGLCFFDNIRKKRENENALFLEMGGFTEVMCNDDILKSLSKYTQEYFYPGKAISCFVKNDSIYVVRSLCAYINGQEFTVTFLAIKLSNKNTICGFAKNLYDDGNPSIIVKELLQKSPMFRENATNLCFSQDYLIKIYRSPFQVFQTSLNLDIKMLLTLDNILTVRNETD